MPRDFVVGIPTLNRYDLLARLLQNLNDKDSTVDRIAVVDNGGKLHDYIDENSDLLQRVNVYSPHKNIGVSASWNFIMHNFCSDIALLVNDDVTFCKNSLKIIRKFIDKDTKNGIWTTSARTANNFSCFAISKKFFEKIGDFDESFYPAYFEDNDYAFRIKLAKEEFVYIDDVVCNHDGSSTLKKFDSNQMEDHHKSFRKNRDYYMAKWGGMPEYERFTIPFAGGTYAPRS